ncbi:apolipoprotein N-acyltransferase [Roseibacillus ishigakijimensis]|uniref:Apolipoprotein N-acyltransferase n=1 Tax=Roseibacillus ishigakijimensis TaxID=454146 RepID=A0A934VL43_9BACT|nr:apolipoprotein N-acyltransferase [Roseibacillus ishigakijimensis]MBK1832741.1 apolipoprotein N-acyltransferase [Roseibacillus ishigakijimensis]
MKTVLTVLWPLLLSLLGGVLLALCFAPFDWPDLVWLAPVAWLAALWLGGGERKRKRFGFLTASVGGFVFWALNLKWLASVAGGAYLILALYLALFFGLFGLFAATTGNPFRRKRAPGTRLAEAGRSLAYAALNGGVWCGLEWLRGWLFTGFGWNGLGVAFHDRLPLAQGAEFVGVTGLAFLPVFTAAVLVQVGVRLAAGVRVGRVERHWDFAATILFLIAVFTFGVFRTFSINRAPSEALRVLLVQMDIPQTAGKVHWTPEEVHEGYESETRAAFAAVDALNEKLVAEAEGEVELAAIDWVVWPEVVLYGPLLSLEEERYVTYEPSSSTITRMQELGARNFIAGIGEIEGEIVDEIIRPRPDGTHYNSLLAVNPESELSVHRKQHLVIYGEFIPFVDSVQWLADIYEKVAGVKWAGNMGRGTGAEGFSLPGAGGEVRVIPSICFEDTVPRVTRKFSEGPREIIVNITNDGWFGKTEGSQQHFDNALFRTIELRRPMVRAANRGVTGVVSATGSLVDYRTGEEQVLRNEEGKPFTRGHVRGRAYIRESGGPTLYARFGDWFAALGLFAGLAAVFWQKARARSRRS